MATVRDTYGNVVGQSDIDRYKDKYGNWVYAIVEGGLTGTQIKDTYGNQVGEIRDDRIYDTYGNWKAEIRGDRIYDTSGNWLFTVD
jgi:hypothetical protein